MSSLVAQVARVILIYSYNAGFPNMCKSNIKTGLYGENDWLPGTFLDMVNNGKIHNLP